MTWLTQDSEGPIVASYRHGALMPSQHKLCRRRHLVTPHVSNYAHQRCACRHLNFVIQNDWHCYCPHRLSCVPIGRDRAGETSSAVKFIVSVSGEPLIVACRGHSRRLASRTRKDKQQLSAAGLWDQTVNWIVLILTGMCGRRRWYRCLGSGLERLAACRA
jgi:hypothetical protein